VGLVRSREEGFQKRRHVEQIPARERERRQHGQRQRHHGGGFVRMRFTTVLAEEGEENGAEDVERGSSRR